MAKINRVLYLVNPLACYGEAFLYDGLCEVLGPSNVIDYMPKFHEQNVWEYIQERPHHPFQTEESICTSFDMFDVLIIASIKNDTLEMVLKWSKDRKLPPLIILDEDENPRFHDEIDDVLNPICYFKREYLLNREYPNHCYPLPFSAPYPLIEEYGDRDIDIFCAMADNYPQRRWIDWLLQQLGHGYYTVVHHYHRNIPYSQYLSEMQRAKIAIAVRGVGMDTNRFLEAISAHTLLITDETSQVKPYPFIDKKHCCYFEMGNIGWIIKHYLDCENELREIADNGYNHLKKYHTTKARAEYFLDIVEGYLAKDI